MIRAVIFDVGGVLVPFDFKRAYSRLEAVCPYPAPEIPQRIRAANIVTQFECGQTTPRAFFESICPVLELRIPFEEFAEIFCGIFTGETLVPESLVARIDGTRKLILLSNTNAIHFPMLERTYPILRHFGERVLSYEIGAVKPSPRIYQEAIRRAGCTPEECFFTDDVEAYVEAARREGIDAVQFRSAGQIEAELLARGVVAPAS